ncbi:MerR family transcriptional regulator [Kitasatospora sp. CM 4170]|uniref:MerR family transcriptional regulator n=1 Tax=Kitasatospora aburaviensis TaxID=67265 RepID=A0ABW1F9H3_9ACTN|nr:MerR family transcriptional regulator [Kitasatospora sp. CM 4170]WNM49784.1 MerR family transcriptional regulator [Kitasatospora sp. CM 4170]
MRIGDLSRRTSVPARLLRYYEEQGLLHPDRDSNGYRSYAPDAVSTVLRIRDLLDAGLTTDAIRRLLPCAHDDEPGVAPCTKSLGVMDERLNSLAEQIARLQRQQELLSAQREATVLRG